jgi:nucleotide-binding universal stress UspA family protein
MFRKILVPIDASDCAGQALEIALDLAGSQGAELTVINVVDPAKAALASTDPYGGTAVPWLEAMTGDGETLLAAAKAKAQARGIAVKTLLLNGYTVEQIVRAASNENCDLIVLGSHGRTGLPRMLIGSVAEGVMREASAPALIVHARVPASSASR